MDMNRQIISIPYFTPPGQYSPNMVSSMLAFGRRLRDEWLWQYPLLPGAVYIYQQMASNREWKVTGKPRGVARAVEYLNNAQALSYDGTVDYGFEVFEKRRALDHLTIGRTLCTWGTGGLPLRYLDPTQVQYYFEEKKWLDNYTMESFDPANMVAIHPIPIGSQGNFISPLSPIIETAKLAWLVRQHDLAAADGRKIRDILVVAGSDMQDKIQEAILDALALWTGEADASKNGIPVIAIDPSSSNRSVQDMIGRIGLANIPENFKRDEFQFQYVNEIAAATGLALRYIWNSEKATNRALEEVQEARQAQKGPSAYVRTEQRYINGSGMLRQFGEEIKMAFIEEVDTASREVNAKVIELYSRALAAFAEVFNGQVNGDAFLAWLQGEDILPADLDLITNVGTLKSDEQTTPTKGNKTVQSDDMTTRNKAVEIDFDEITMNNKGVIVQRRPKIFDFQSALSKQVFDELEKAVLEGDDVIEVKKASWVQALEKARTRSLDKFKEVMKSESIDDEEADEIYAHIDTLTDDDHRAIKRILDRISA